MEIKEKVNINLADVVPKHIKDNFWSKVDRSGGEDSCWIWLASGTRGYGRFMFKGKRYKSHRFAYELTVGSIPEDLFICHHCDNKICVNPKHLYPGTAKDNARDAVLRGRLGKTKPNKLSLDNVLEIRRLYESGISQDKLAIQFNSSLSNIRSIITRQTWTMVSGIKKKPVLIKTYERTRNHLKDEMESIHMLLDSLKIPRTIKNKNSRFESLMLIDRIKIALKKR